MWGVDDYPRSWAGTYDPYLFALRQCAAFANWRCVNDFKIGPIRNPTGSCDGGQFAGVMAKLGRATVDGNPRVHDIVSLPPGVDDAGRYGHVAVVLAVNNNGTILVEDYNWYGTQRYLQHTIPSKGCLFAHINGVAPPAPTPAPSPPSSGGLKTVDETSLVRAVIRMAWWGIGRGEPDAQGLADYTNAALAGNVDNVVASLRDSPEGGAWVHHTAEAALDIENLLDRVATLETKAAQPAPAPAPAPVPVVVAPVTPPEPAPKPEEPPKPVAKQLKPDAVTAAGVIAMAMPQIQAAINGLPPKEAAVLSSAAAVLFAIAKAVQKTFGG